MTHILKQNTTQAMTATLLMTKPTRVVNFATVFPLVKIRPQTMVALARTEPAEVRLVRAGTGNASVALPLKAAPARKHAPLTSLESAKLAVPRISGVMSRAAGTAELEPLGTAELNLPFGMPRFVNVATLKSMLNAQRSDVLLKRNGERWDICEDSMKVDLRDATVEFRMGAVQIFS